MDLVSQYFRCPSHSFRNLSSTPHLSRDRGYFLFGADTVCFGRSSAGFRQSRPNKALYDVVSDVLQQSSRLVLPFEPDEVITNLSQEWYMRADRSAIASLVNGLIRKVYYAARPFFPLAFRSKLQEIYLSDWQQLKFPEWPVDTTIDGLMRKILALAIEANGNDPIPFIWFWPDGANACAIMTHDVEEEIGRAFCSKLMDINDEYRIPASFQVVPEKRYEVTSHYLDEIRARGYEVAVQDLNHDGRLYWELGEFKRRVTRINEYGRNWEAKGFRAAILYRNEQWFDSFDFDYDMSIPNVAHLDPQRGGCCTVMPFFIGNLVELPVTATQDHSMFHILHDYSLDLWRQQISRIVGHNGLISFIVHPDYILEDRPQAVYRDLLRELCQLRDEKNVWIALPGEVSRWWRERNAMTLELRDGHWVAEGQGKERARVAYATLEGGRLVLEVPTHSAC